jgi:ribosomal protein S18 acetylase RimI-like enzyme
MGRCGCSRWTARPAVMRCCRCDSRWSSGGLGYIDDLFVKQDYRRRGVARAGLDVLLEDCRRRGCRAIHVEVAPDNVAAIALYRSSGWAPEWTSACS